MIKTISFTSFILFVNLFATAQESGFGVKVGVNFVTYQFENKNSSYTPDRVLKAQAGVLYEKIVTESFSYQGELLWNSTGFMPDEGSGVHNISINYISMPIILKLWIHKKINFNFGPQINYLVKAKADDDNFTSSTNKIGFDFNFGAEAYLGKTSGLNFRYGLGMSNIDKSDDLTVKSSNLLLSVFMKF